MSISHLTDYPSFNMKIGNITCNELNSNDTQIENLNVLQNMSVQGDCAIIGTLELANPTNIFTGITGTQGQVLSLGSNDQLQWLSIGSQGGGITGITTGTSNALQISENNNVVNINYIGQSSGIQSVTGSANQVTATTSDNAVVLTLPSQVNMQNLNVANSLEVGNVVYPNVLGSNSQILAVNNGALGFVTPTEGGITSVTTGTPSNLAITENNNVVNINFTPSASIQSVTGTANQITAQTSNENVVLSLPSQVNMQNLTTSTLEVGNVVYPNVIGSNSQILAVNNGSLGFVTPTEGGITAITTGTPSNLAITENNNVVNIDFTPSASIQSVTGTANQITAQTSNENVVLSLPTNVTMQNLTTSTLEVGNVQIPSVKGSANQCIGVDASGNVNFINVATGSITGGTNINVSNNIVSLSNNIDLGNNTASVTLGQSGFNQVIIEDNKISLTNTQYNSSLEVDGNSLTLTYNSIPVVELNDTGIYANNINVSNSGGSAIYKLPTTLGSANQVLTSTGTTGSALTWSTISPGGSGITAINTNTPTDLAISEASGVVTINYTGNVGSGTVNNVTAGSNILINPTTANASTYNISLNPTLNVTSLASNNGTNNISLSGANGLVAQLDGTNQSSVVEPTFIRSNEIKISDASNNVLYSLPSVAGQPNQVLSYPVTGNTCTWETVQGGSNYTAGDGIAISNDVISVQNDLTTVSSLTIGQTTASNVHVDELTIVIEDVANGSQTALSSDSLLLTSAIGGPPQILLMNTGSILASSQITTPTINATTINVNSAYTLPAQGATSSGDVITYNGSSVVWGPPISSSTDLSINNLNVANITDSTQVTVGQQLFKYTLPLQKPASGSVYLACDNTGDCSWQSVQPYNYISFNGNSSSYYGATPQDVLLSESTGNEIVTSCDFYYTQTIDLLRISMPLNLMSAWKFIQNSSATRTISTTFFLPLDWMIVANLGKVYRASLPCIVMSSTQSEPTTEDLMGSFAYISNRPTIELRFVQFGASNVQVTLSIYYPTMTYSTSGEQYIPSTYTFNPTNQSTFAIISEASLFDQLGNVPIDHFVSMSF